MESEPANRDRELFTWEGVREKNRSSEMWVLIFWTAAFKKDIFTMLVGLSSRWYSNFSQYLPLEHRPARSSRMRLLKPID